MSKRRSPEQWRSILSAFHRSGQSQAEFCARKGLSLSTLQYQLRRERHRTGGKDAGEAATPQLLELALPKGPSGLPEPCGSALRVECSLDSPHVTIECPPGQLGPLLAELSALHQLHQDRP